jgi:TolB protein
MREKSLKIGSILASFSLVVGAAYFLWSAWFSSSGVKLGSQAGAPSFRIAFAAWDRGQEGTPSEVYVADPSGVTNVSRSPAADYLPQLSPDGTRIAFVSGRSGNPDIYVMNSDGTNVQRVTTDPHNETEPHWSPDGSSLIFQRDDDQGYSDLFSANIDGAGETQLTFSDSRDENPSFSPDGQHIAFARYVDDNREIFVANRDGSDETRITYLPGEDDVPTWSPDGSRLSFVRSAEEDNNYDLFVVDLLPVGDTVRAGVPHPLVVDPLPEHLGVWSGDGRELFFFRVQPDGSDLRVLDAATGEERDVNEDALSPHFADLLRIPIFGVDFWGDLPT